MSDSSRSDANRPDAGRRDLSRRRFMATSAIATGAFLSASRPKSAKSAEAVVSEIRTISSPNGRYHGWPTLTQRSNGELLVVCSGGRELHVCPFGRVDLFQSRDGGQTWSWPRTILDSATDDRDAGILETSKGTLLATTFTSLAYEPGLTAAEKSGKWDAERLQQWQSARDRLSADERKAELGCWMIRSTDGGLSWSSRYRCLVNSPHGPIQLSDGRQLYAGKQLWTGKDRVGVAESKDDGATWTWLAEIPTRKGDDHMNYHELHAVEASDGRIIAQIRNHNSTDSRETLQAESDDGGKTWTEPHSIGVWGLPSHLMQLNDGRLLMTYGYRRKPFGNQARVSKDNGSTWSDPLTISADGASGDLGYPSTIQRPDGTLITVWYERPAGSERAVLRMATWSLRS